jgi:F0F1-type ATP synthase gamma subunit
MKEFEVSRLIKGITSLKSITNAQKEVIESTIKQAIKEFSTLIYAQRIQEFAKKITSSNDK